MRTYRRAWVGATRTVVVLGGILPLAAWCVVSPWTFAAALAAACWGGRLAGRAPSGAVGRLRRRLAAAPLDVHEWQLLRLLPVVSLAAVGWGMLLGAVGAALLLVDAALGVPLLLADRHDRWPDGRDVGDIPDTVAELAPTGVVEVLEGRGRRSPARSEPPPVPAGEPAAPVDEAPDPPPETPAPSEEAPDPDGAAPVPAGRSTGGPPAASVAWPGPRTLLPDLDDDELLHAWEASTRALGLRPGPTALLRIVTARARYLDALAERDPDGLARRLAMGERDDWWFDSPT